MKLSVRMAGICGSGAFILAALPGFYQQAKPVDISQMATGVLPGMNIIETLLISLGGSIVAGFIGYLIGDILANPKGPPKKKKQPKAKAKARPFSPAQPLLVVPETDLPPVTDGVSLPEAPLPESESSIAAEPER